MVRERDEVRRNIGLVFQDPTLDGYLRRPSRTCACTPSSTGSRRGWCAADASRYSRWSGCGTAATSQVSTFSGGMRRRLEIARGLMHSPRVLFLDEPTIGLDPQTRSSIWRYIRELQQSEEITIFMTTHYMDEAEYCDRIAIMDSGEIVALDTPEALKASVGKDRVRIETADDEAAIAALQAPVRHRRRVAEGAVTFARRRGRASSSRACSPSSACRSRSVSVARPSLDDVFMRYTGSTIRDAEASQRRDATHGAAMIGGMHESWRRDAPATTHRGRAGPRPAPQPRAATCAR